MPGSLTCTRLRRFGTSIFTEMTELANRHQALNLGQGFPDFEGPQEIKDVVIAALGAGRNQYCRSAGVRELVAAIAEHQRAYYGLAYDPWDEITVTCGATEALFSTFQGLLEAGDEVVLFEPFFDAYPAGVRAAGGTPRAVTLEPPDFALEPAALEAAITPRTRAILVNTPHNPTGRVLYRRELEAIAEVCLRHDLIAVSDEVYEHLVFEGEHIPLATIDGMRERTITISSMGKSFSFTGFKVGWACAPAALTAALRTAHQFVTFSTPAPLQLAAAHALGLGEAYFVPYVAAYRARRDLLCAGLEAAGFRVMTPAGAYFVLADIQPLGHDDDLAFCRMLPATVGVAAIPPSAFYTPQTANRHLVRFTFSKRRAVLEAAIARLAKVPRGARRDGDAVGAAWGGAALGGVA